MPSRMVEFASDGTTTQGYLATPESGGGPGVIVIQEWWGLVDHIKEVVDRFAKSGFVALAPDLYHGESTQSPDDAGRLMMALDIGRSAKDLEGAVSFLLGDGGATSQKVGTVGFCMGGQLALAAACASSNVGACVDFYGVHPSVTLDFSQLSAPVLGLFAENDGFVSPEVARKLEHDIRSSGKQVQIHIYPGVDHAFFNDSRPDVYDAKAAGDAWDRTVRHFRENLR
ncbi:MAG: dienelactone hydrolase family protein [Myxococcota bacterium]